MSVVFVFRATFQENSHQYRVNLLCFPPLSKIFFLYVFFSVEKGIFQMNSVLVCVQSGFNLFDDLLTNIFNKNSSLFHFNNACGSRGDFLFFLIKACCFWGKTPKKAKKNATKVVAFFREIRLTWLTPSLFKSNHARIVDSNQYLIFGERHPIQCIYFYMKTIQILHFL